MFLLGFFMSDDAASEDEPFSSAGVSPRRKDTWRSWVSQPTTSTPSPDVALTPRPQSRWRRAIFYGGRKRTLLKCVILAPDSIRPGTGLTPARHRLVLFVFFLAALATAALGMWASGTALREALKKGAATSLGCTPPV